MSTFMKSAYLQKRHDDTYRRFFQRHDLVVSANHTFRWGSSTARGSAIIPIKQKLPCKMFCGVSTLPGGEDKVTIHFGDVIWYEQEKDTFTRVPCVQVIGQPTLDVLSEIVSKLLVERGYTESLVLDILSEYPRGRGFGFVGVLFTLVSMIIHILTKELDISVLDTVDAYDDFVGSAVFLSIHRMATYIDHVCMGKSSGILPYICLATQDIPYFMLDNSPVPLVDHTDISDYLAKGHTIHDISVLLGKEIHVEDIPLDYGIISFGVKYDSKHIKQVRDDIGVMYQDIAIFAKELYTMCNCDTMDMFDKDIDVNYMSSLLHINILRLWKRMLGHRGEKYYIDAFIQHIVDCGIFSVFLEKEKKNMIDMYYLFDQIKQGPEEKIGVTPVSSAKSGGSFLFVCPHGASRNTLEEMLSQLHAIGYTHACFSYLSWRDGGSREGINVHQHISSNVYSSYIKPGSVLFTGGDGRSYIESHEVILEQEINGIVLDKIYNKIYLNGKKLTHKDLRSQSSTVEILDQLLKRPGVFIDNTELPISSYSKNKNEMLGKIVLPFIELVKRNYDIDLPLECTGSIYAFQIRLKDTAHLLSRIESLF